MRPIVALPIVLALAACSGGSTSPTRGADTGRIGAIPAERHYPELEVPGEAPANTVTSMSYNPQTQVLTIRGEPFDMAGTYRRRPERDVQGFAAFENVAGARRYLALVRSEDGVAAGVVGTPVRLDTTFGGTMVARDSVPTELPRNVEVYHSGTYAGIRNVGTNVGGDTSNAFLHRVEGRVWLDFDFFDDGAPLVEGLIYDRRSMDETVTDENGFRRVVTYDDVVLRNHPVGSNIAANIDEDGVFGGAAAIRGSVVGEYYGVIGDSRATTSAGVVEFRDDGEFERGAFTTRQRR